MLKLVDRTWITVAAAMVVAGIVLLIVSGRKDDAAGIAGFALLGLGAILATGLAFYAVGRSEDIARERGEH